MAKKLRVFEVNGVQVPVFSVDLSSQGAEMTVSQGGFHSKELLFYRWSAGFKGSLSRVFIDMFKLSYHHFCCLLSLSTI